MISKSSRSISRSCFFWVGHMFWLLVKKPEEVKIILNAEETFEKTDHGVSLYLEHGLLTDGGEKYKLQRRTIMPFFVPSNLKKIFTILNHKTEEFFEKFDKEISSEEFDLTPFTMSFAFSAILKTILNIDNIPESQLDKLKKAFRTVPSIAIIRIFKIWLSFDFIFKHTKLHKEWTESRRTGFGFVEDVIKENEENYQSGRVEKTSRILIDLLYQIRDTMTYKEMVQSVYLLISAGFETSGVSIPNILLLLAMNPSHQEKCYEEICSAFNSPDDNVLMDKFYGLTYLDCCIKEGLRLIAPVLFLSRKVEQDLKLGKIYILI